MKIGVYSNPQKDRDGEVRKLLLAACAARGIEAEQFSPQNYYDFAVSIGGDGTILRVARECAATGVPILGINLGTVGFLTEVEPSEIERAADKLAARDYILERRALDRKSVV